ncbi:MAG TPA: HipA family kinase [Actinomycetes bacterium]|nr:HipA family kinase [Actinomycetes bacterium]
MVAEEFVEGLTSASKPQKFRCDDGQLYAVKFRNNPYGDGRAIVAEHVVSLFGTLIGAPVAEVRLVTVTSELLTQLNIVLDAGGPAAVGVHHGSRWVDGFSDRFDIRYADENRQAFAALHILYSWLFCNGDHQFIYRNAEPHDVLSVDHSSFLPDGTGWSAQRLRAHQDQLQLDPFFDSLALKQEEAADALDRLARLQPADIARVIATPPDEWGVSADDRVALAEYAEARRRKILENFGLEAR